jgi:hypothetical protein
MRIVATDNEVDFLLIKQGMSDFSDFISLVLVGTLMV